MSKKSILLRESKRRILVKKFFEKRIKIKNEISKILNPNLEKWNLILKLQKFPRNSVPSRLRNRCNKTGRPRGFLRRFGLSRIKLREMTMLGLIPGLKKSSW